MKINGKDVRLPKRFKAKWVKALKSGEIHQTTGQLLSYSGGMCCIGVAGKVCGIPNNEMKEKGIFGVQSFKTKNLEKFVNKYKYPKLLLGSIDDMQLDFNPIVKKLANFNDKGKSFSFIAGYIQRNL